MRCRSNIVWIFADCHCLIVFSDSVPSASLAIAPTGTPTSAAYQSSSSGLPGGCSTDGIHEMFPGCVFVDDDDGSLQYSEGWNFSTSDPNGLIHTLHFTQTPGSSVSLTFNGSSTPSASWSDTDTYLNRLQLPVLSSSASCRRVPPLLTPRIRSTACQPPHPTWLPPPNASRINNCSTPARTWQALVSIT